jgi:hypothetical protein
VPKLRQILSTALRHGCSVSRLLDRLTDAINGAYRVKGDYTDKDYDRPREGKFRCQSRAFSLRFY